MYVTTADEGFDHSVYIQMCVCVLGGVLQDTDSTAELHATTVLTLLEHLQLTDVTLVMHDLGGEECLTRAVSTVL